jgi:hypothetical protein
MASFLLYAEPEAVFHTKFENAGTPEQVPSAPVQLVPSRMVGNTRKVPPTVIDCTADFMVLCAGGFV